MENERIQPEIAVRGRKTEVFSGTLVYLSKMLLLYNLIV